MRDCTKRSESSSGDGTVELLKKPLTLTEGFNYNCDQEDVVCKVDETGGRRTFSLRVP